MALLSLSTGLKALFLALGCAMVASAIYTISIDGSPFRKDVFSPWLSYTLVDFYCHVGILAAWITYKESNFLAATIWIVLFICLGSIATCIYILVQLLKLSPQESSEDPIYHVLLRHEHKTVESASFRSGPVEQRKIHSPVVTARIIFGFLDVVMLVCFVYTLVTDGSPIRKDVFTPWLNATFFDFFVNAVVFAVWIAHREPNWISAILWILFMNGFGSIITFLYLVQQLSLCASHEPLYLVLLNRSDRAENMYERV